MKPTKRNLFFIFFAILLAFLLLIFFKNIKLKYRSPSNQKNRNEVLSPISKPSPTPYESKEISDLVFSLDHSSYIYTTLKDLGKDTGLLSYQIYSFENTDSFKISFEGENLESNTFFKIEGDIEVLRSVYNNPTSFITWSATGENLAVITPKKVVLFNITTGKNNDTETFYKIDLIKDVEIEKVKSFYDLPMIMFSDNGDRLYIASKNFVKEVYPEEIDIKVDKGFYGNLYPVPNSSYFAYFVQKEDSSINKHYFIVQDGNKKSEYEIKSDYSMDSIYDLFLSPDRSKSCIVYKTSGYQGSSLFDINTGNEISTGKGCMRFLNNNELVTYETSYYGGELNVGKTVFYLLNLQTGEKQFINTN